MSTEQRTIRGLKNAIAHARGGIVGARMRQLRVPNDIDVRAIRQKLGLSQREFALQFRFSLGTVRHWEQDRHVPDGPARVLLRVIDREPEAVKRALCGR
jgi:putative transcriptional regulator